MQKKEDERLSGTTQYAVRMVHVTKAFGKKVIANKDVNLELKRVRYWRSLERMEAARQLL